MLSFQSAIPTHLVTGFLGVGKTTLIRAWLRQKPADEHWGVLVNEFGAVGIDDAFLETDGNESGLATIRQVAGGCMCCAAGLPFQVALNDLIRRARPDRILIEPTGLGHPGQLLAQLREYTGVLSVGASIGLLDARVLADERYTEHPIYLEQLDIADVLVANKSDQYHEADIQRLDTFLSHHGWHHKPLLLANHGDLPVDVLQRPAASGPTPSLSVLHRKQQPGDDVWQANRPDFSQDDLLCTSNQRDGFHSLGWQLHPKCLFRRNALLAWLTTMPAERIKGVVITEQGIVGLNQVGAELQVIAIDEVGHSRLEFISAGPLDEATLTRRLVDCLVA